MDERYPSRARKIFVSPPGILNVTFCLLFTGIISAKNYQKGDNRSLLCPSLDSTNSLGELEKYLPSGYGS